MMIAKRIEVLDGKVKIHIMTFLMKEFVLQVSDIRRDKAEIVPAGKDGILTNDTFIFR